MGKARNYSPFSKIVKYKPVPTNNVSMGGPHTQPDKVEMRLSKEFFIFLF
jgi:hypothetical protein